MRTDDVGDVTPQTPDGGNQVDTITAGDIKASDSITSGDEEPEDTGITAGMMVESDTPLWWAEQFARYHVGPNWKYCVSSKMWYNWNGKYWEQDTKNRIREECRAFLICKLKDVDGDMSDADVQHQLDIIKKLCNRRSIEDIITITQSFRHIAISEKDLDKDPYVLNLINGELDLKTGILSAHYPEHLHSKCCGVKYDPTAKCPEWEKHVITALEGDSHLVNNVQEILGYSLFHGNPESIFSIFCGSGRNGKSVTLETIESVLGTYAVNVNPSCLMESGSAPGSDRMKMIGARLVVASEPGDTAKGRCALDSSFIKAATGGDSISSRRLYCESIEFKVGGLVVIATNTMPMINDQSIAMRERVWAVPWDHYFAQDERKKDIREILFAEGSGILNWMLEGYRRYTTSGRLKQCRAISSQTGDYLDSEDGYHEFFKDAGIVRRDNLSIPASRLYEKYLEWCRERCSDRVKSSTSFGRHMGQRFQKKRTESGILYIGIGDGGQAVIDGGCRDV